MLLGLLIGLTLLGGLTGYLWYQRTPLTPGSLARRAPLPALMQLRRSTVLVAAGLLLVICLGTVYLVRAFWPAWKRPTASLTAAPPATSPTGAAFLERFPKEYPMVVKPEPKPLPPKGVPVAPPEPGLAQAAPAVPAPTPPPLSRPEVEAMIERAKRDTLAQQQAMLDQAVARLLAGQQRSAQTQPTPEQAAGQRPAKREDDERTRKKKAWGASPPTSMQAKADEKSKPPADPVKEKAQALIPDAVWVQPDHPERILFRDQFIPGVLQDAANSDIPGQLRILVTRDVLDRGLSGQVLIPKLSTVMTTLTSQPAHGQTLLDITADQVIFPGGTRVLNLASTKLGEADGSTGVAANVNNHYGKLFLATGINAVLALGTQSLAGTPSNYYPNPAQQAARDASQQVSGDVRTIVQQQLKVPPTLKQWAGHEVTLHLSQNINLGTAPVRVP